MKKIVIVIPVFNDWESLEILIEKIHGQAVDATITILCVDDGSTQAMHFDKNRIATKDGCVAEVHRLKLIRNVGHQRAIALGLYHVYANFSYDRIIVMDSDGEDMPESLPSIIRKAWENEEFIVVGKRAKRSESLAFKSFYFLYKCIFWLLTGMKLEFGNFMALTPASLKILIHMPELWNSFTATILKSRCPFVCVKCDRGKRYKGQSKMAFSSLIIHGMSALSVFSDTAFARLLLFAAFVTFTTIFFIVGIAITKCLTDDALIPGWTSTISLVLMVFMGMVGVFSLYFMLTYLSGRSFKNIRVSEEAGWIIDEQEQIL